MRAISISILGDSDATVAVEVMTSVGAPVEGLLDAPEQVVAVPLSLDTLNVTWTIPQVVLLLSQQVGVVMMFRYRSWQ